MSTEHGLNPNQSEALCSCLYLVLLGGSKYVRNITTIIVLQLTEKNVEGLSVLIYSMMITIIINHHCILIMIFNESMQNLVTLVTGGTGCLGYGVVHRLARKGAYVILSDLPSTNGDQMAKELGENVTFIPADVTSEKDVQHLVDEIKNKYKTLNVIANCAGTSCTKPFYDFSENRPICLEDFQDVIQVSNIKFLYFKS